MIDDEDHRSQNNFGSSLRDFLEQLGNQGLPDGWRESPFGSKIYNIAYNDGYMQATEEYEKTLDALRHILDLEEQRSCCE